MRLEIADTWIDVADQALAQLRRAHPPVIANHENGVIQWSDDIHGEDAALIEQKIWEALYRERIYKDTLDIRRRIYNG